MNADKWSQVRATIGSGRLSVIMPVFNLANQIADNLRETISLFEQHKISAELILVDDGSTDGTDKILASFKRDGEVSLRPIILQQNSGKGAAIRAGFAASTGDFVLLLDGDLDIHPKQTPWFFEEMISKNADIVVGSKRHPKSDVQYPFHRRLISWVYFTLVRFTIGLPITDTQTGMKLFRREILREALGRMIVKDYAFDLELLSIAYQRGARIAEAPVVIRFGQKFGCLSLSTIKKMAIDSLAVFYRLKILNYYKKAILPNPPNPLPKVSVVIACPKNSAYLAQCLDALEKQTYKDVEIIVLPDETFAAPNKNVKVIPTGVVRPAEKRNMALKVAKGEIIAFIDDDAYPDMHWIETAVNSFGEKSVGAVGGPAITPKCDSFLSQIGGRIYENILVSGNYRYRYKAWGIRREVDDYPSCNLFVRSNLLREIGGYRTDFWPGEDTLLCKDLVDRNARIVYEPWAVVFHHRRAFIAAHLRQLARYAFHRGYFVKRFPSNSLRLSYFIPSLFVLYLFSSCVLAVFIPAKFIFFLFIPFVFYLALVVITSFSFNPIAWALTSLGVFLSHIVYGVQFVRGLLASRAPCEFLGKDHAGGK